MLKNKVFTTSTSKETITLGENLGKVLAKNSIVCLFGDLAAGKTTFIKGVAAAYAGCSQDEVNSPTFVYLNIYGGQKKLFHFDLYRLEGHEDFLSMGFDEYLYSGDVACIEWSERIEKLIPPDAIRVEFKHLDGGRRQISMSFGTCHE